MENGFHFHIVLKSYQASLTVQKGTIDKLLFFTENYRHLPMACVNDPLNVSLLIRECWAAWRANSCKFSDRYCKPRKFCEGFMQSKLFAKVISRRQIKSALAKT